jgi:hypothetical protein
MLGAGWLAFAFAAALGRPDKLINDAAMQALGMVFLRHESRAANSGPTFCQKSSIHFAAIRAVPRDEAAALELVKPLTAERAAYLVAAAGSVTANSLPRLGGCCAGSALPPTGSARRFTSGNRRGESRGRLPHAR